MKVAELFAELGFKTDTVTLNDFIGMIGKLNINTIFAAAGVEGLYNGLKDIMKIGEDSALAINMFGKETGLSGQKMVQWTRYAQDFGVQGEAVSSTLSGLQKKLIGLKLGTDSSLLTPFYMLNQAGAGITGNENPFELVEKFLAVKDKLDPALRTTIAGMMGINEQLLVMKNFKGASLIDVLNPEDVTRLTEFHKSVTELGNAWKNVWEGTASLLAPMIDGLAKITKYFVDLGKHSKTFREILAGTLLVIAAVLAVMGGPIAATILLLTILAGILGEVVHYWDQIKAKIPDLSLGGLQKAATTVGTNVGNTIQSGAKNVSTTMSNVFHIVSNDAHAVAKAVDERLNKHLSDAQYQQPLVSR